MTLGYLTITVSARDLGNPTLSSEVDVIIYITDINDHAPYFKDPNITISILEESMPNQLFKSQAYDADEGENGIINYRMIIGNTSYFNCFENGSITLSKPINIEDGGEMKYEIEIKAYNSKPYTPGIAGGVQTITVEIKDINDNKPYFNQNMYSFAAKESDKIGTKLNGRTSILAIDKDETKEFNTVTYFLSGSDDSTYFSIDENSGELYIAKPFDYEKQAIFIFKVFATDGEPFAGDQIIANVSANVTVSISDVNDNIPTFTKGCLMFQNVSQYQCIFEEESMSSRCSVNATDADSGRNGEMMYKIKQKVINQSTSDIEFLVCTSNCSVVIDSKTGILKPREAIKRDEEYPVIEFIVEAIDGGIPSLTGTAVINVLIRDINNNAPIFYNQKSTYVFEELDKPQYFHTAKAYDNDIGENGRVIYRLNSNKNGLFKLFENGTLTATKKLEIHNKNDENITLLIEAYNNVPYTSNKLENGTQTMTIIIKDVNDHFPKFDNSSYVFHVPENATVGQVLDNRITINAVDKDFRHEFNTVSYWITGAGKEFFTIDRYTGIIRVAKALDYEQQRKFNLTVVASDMHVYVLNDTYINASVSVAILVEDINDNKPKFTQDIYHCAINEETTGIVPKCNISASDKDKNANGAITYQLMNVQTKECYFPCSNSKENEVFEIETQGIDTKEVEVCSLHRQWSKYKNVDGKAVDHGNPPLSGSALVLVYIEDINNHSPIFDDKEVTYVFDELRHPKTSIQLKLAHDADVGSNGKVFYKLSPVTDNTLFSIDKDNGKLTALSQLKITKVNDGKRTVQIEAYNSNPYSSSTIKNDTQSVIIYIKDVNDHSPVFEKATYNFNVAENTNFGQRINENNRIIAIDNDTSMEYSTIHYWLEKDGNGHFVIMDNGEIRVSKLLDYERNTTFTFKVFASDMHQYKNTTSIKTSSAVINIKVTDVNDNAPHFIKSSYIRNLENL
ncbi:hypothetical protein KUTeg_004416 [Tegillarca granosa]|uniref:Cadherin domain-containing protein n=1 Tax=Tegillarca granosa TaxID=220873 RepID=A0ABQ9FPY3_TEGGR|nr:hypothetical protein KUTeg_004416 [Tegillarca granosa]